MTKVSVTIYRYESLDKLYHRYRALSWDEYLRLTNEVFEESKTHA